jgi:hypothetical protein
MDLELEISNLKELLVSINDKEKSFEEVFHVIMKNIFHSRVIRKEQVRINNFID